MLRWTVCLKEGPTSWHNAAVPVELKIYVFGSYSNVIDSDQIDVHIFNTVSLRWRKLSPVTNGGAEGPCRRRCHTAVLLQDFVYIWGGSRRFSVPYLNILYAFDVDTHRWLKPKVSGTVPEGREGHSACVFGKLMYVHGGYNLMSGRTYDIYKLDTTLMFWSLINTRGTPPPVSAHHSATIIGTKMFVFGGYSGNNECYNNIRVFDTETNCCLSLPSAKLVPRARSAHSAFTYNGELYIFGGEDRTIFNDLWKFSPETLTWKKIEPKGKGPDRMSGMCCSMVGDRIILFGGCNPHGLYILDLSPSLKSLCKLAVIQYSVEQSGLPHDIRWELAAMTKN